MLEREPGGTNSLMDQLSLTTAEIERRMKFVDLGEGDIQRIKALSSLVLGRLDALTATFFAHLANFNEASALIRNPVLLDRARKLKTAHLQAMVAGVYGTEYVEERLKLALLYTEARLDPRLFLGAFHNLMRAVGQHVMAEGPGGPLENFEHFVSLQKLGFFDISLIIDVMMFERERLIGQQQQDLLELSTPVLQIRDRLLILPIIGAIDTQRARQFTESLLKAIRSHRAKVAVIDITGVPVVDSKVAFHLMQTVMAARLMGTLAIITGLSAEVAQAMVTLGVDLGTVRSAGDLQGGLEEAERLLGYAMVRETASPRQPDYR
jgi:rsbT co-antagonist protein RsbR